MKASTERKLIRWLHIVLGIPIVGYIYGSLTEGQIPTMIVRFVMFPLLVLTGFYLWKGHLIKKWIKKQKKGNKSTGIKKMRILLLILSAGIITTCYAEVARTDSIDYKMVYGMGLQAYVPALIQS